MDWVAISHAVEADKKANDDHQLHVGEKKVFVAEEVTSALQPLNRKVSWWRHYVAMTSTPNALTQQIWMMAEVEQGSPEESSSMEPQALRGYLPWEQDLEMVSKFLDRKVGHIHRDKAYKLGLMIFTRDRSAKEIMNYHTSSFK